MERFERLLRHDNWRQVLENPFNLWVVVTDELFRQMDAQVWNLGDVFRGIEGVSNRLLRPYRISRIVCFSLCSSLLIWRLQSTLNSVNRITEYRGLELGFDFVGLHNVAKHCVYLKEGFDAMLLAHDDLISQHSQYFHPLSSSPSLSPPLASSSTPDARSSHQFLATENMLKHNRSLFRSTGLRIASLEKRIANIINLVSYVHVQRKS
jgi:hypothetical protein